MEAALWSGLSQESRQILIAHGLISGNEGGEGDLDALILQALEDPSLDAARLLPLVCAYIAQHPEEHRSLQSRLLPKLLKIVSSVDASLLWDLSREAELGGQVLLLSLLIRLFLPWAEEERVDEAAFACLGFDLRQQAELPSLLQDGLLDPSPTIRKQSLYLLKQLIKWTSVKPDVPSVRMNEDEDDASRLFVWGELEKVPWMEAWSTFFMLYEALGEPQAHLIEPMLPILDRFLQPAARLGVRWWQLLMRRGFVNDSVAVRRRLLECLLASDLEQVPRLKECLVFLLGPMLDLLDNASLFSTGDLTIMVSQFGLRVSQFYARLLERYTDAATACLLFLEQLQQRIRSPLPIIFLLQALLLLPAELKALDPRHLLPLTAIINNRAALHNRTARRLVRLLALQIALHLANPAALSYSDWASFLAALLPDDCAPLLVKSAEWRSLPAWFAVHYGADFLWQHVKVEMSLYLAHADLQRVDQLVCMAALLVRDGEGEGELKFVECLRQIYHRMNQCKPNRIHDLDATPSDAISPMSSSFEELSVKSDSASRVSLVASSTAVVTRSHVVATCLILNRLNEAVRLMAAPRPYDLLTTLSLQSRLFDWMSVIIDHLFNLAEPVNGIDYLGHVCVDWSELEMLVDAMEMLLDAARVERVQLIPFLDMLSLRCIESIQTLAEMPRRGLSETVAQQLAKPAHLRLLAKSLDVAIDLVQQGGLQLLVTDELLGSIMGLGLERPLGMSMEQQQEGWHTLIANNTAAQWRAVASLIAYACLSGAGSLDVEYAFGRCLESLGGSKYGATTAILNCLARVIGCGCLRGEQIEDCLQQCLDLFDGYFDSPRWFDIHYEAFTQLVCQPAVLGKPELAEEVAAVIHHALHEIGPKRRSLMTRLMVKLTPFLLGGEHETLRRALATQLVEVLLFGPQRDWAEEQQAMALLPSGEGETKRPDLSHDPDYLVRAHGLFILLASCEDRELAKHLWSALMDQILCRGMSAKVAKQQGKHVFPNAPLHRRRIRAWQALCVLSTRLWQGEEGALLFAASLADLWETLRREGLPSTRAYTEAMLIRAYTQYPLHLGDLLACLEQQLDLAPAFSCSLLTILHRTTLALLAEPPAGFDLVSHLQRTLAAVLPLERHGSHLVRAHSIYIFDTLLTRTQATQLDCPLPSVYQALLRQSQANGDRFMSKLTDDLILASFDPTRSWNLHFLQWTLPQDKAIARDELISGWTWLGLQEQFGVHSLLVPAFSPGEEMPATSPCVEASQQPEKKLGQEEVPILRDYQQKVAMWDLSLFDTELGEMRKQRELARRQAQFGQITLIASLIDKMPNLGGLCRTAEVLGVTRLVLPSQKIIDHPDFLSLSMTADRWLELVVVAPEELPLYLEQLRHAGNRIVAIEQTAHSTPLQRFQFPRQMALLLGNETEGIPAHLLQLVDDCVEIPQFGMVRSLNVHVSGSLVMWEARKQHL